MVSCRQKDLRMTTCMRTGDLMGTACTWHRHASRAGCTLQLAECRGDGRGVGRLVGIVLGALQKSLLDGPERT
jgi:hypothetical protein